MVLADMDCRPVFLESATIRTEFAGRFAITTFDLVFRNPNDRTLEGTFEFPLREGQTVVGFALDIDGDLRQAVPVEKTRGRIVFEEIERDRVDPGLLEQTAGNNYRARIFPLVSGETRRIVVTVQEGMVTENAVARFELPLDFSAPLAAFAFSAVVPTATEDDVVRVSSTLPWALPRLWHCRDELRISGQGQEVRGTIKMLFPRPSRPRVATQRLHGKDYFVAEVPLARTPDPMRRTPKTVGLLWDASGSAGGRPRDREFAFLDAWLRGFDRIEVKLFALRDTSEPRGTFVVWFGEWSNLRRELETLAFDGASSLDGVTEDRDVDEWILVSDGLFNYGESVSTFRLPLCDPVHTVVVGERSDAARLRGLAAQHGGECVDLARIAPAAAASRLAAHSSRILALDVAGVAADGLVPSIGSRIAGDSVMVAGMLAAPRARIHLRIGHDERRAQEIEFEVGSGESPCSFAARAWAGLKIDELATHRADNRDLIRRLGQEFGVVTSETSLIVLEALDDYVRFDILPPPEWREAWNEMREDVVVESPEDRADHLETVVERFFERVAWWEQEFSKGSLPPRDSPGTILAGEVAAPAVRESESAPNPVVRPGPPSAVESAVAPAAETVPAAWSGPLDPETVFLDPFEVSARADEIYFAASTLAGTRIRAPSHADRIVLETKATFACRDAMLAAPREERYAAYLRERGAYERRPSFYLEAADVLFEQGDEALALRVLSNLAELELDDASLLRVLGNRLVQAGRAELAVPILDSVLTARPNEPQSWRDLGLACAAARRFQRAVDLLWEVVSRPWDSRFEEIDMIALGELNAIVATCGAQLDLTRIDPRLLRNLPVGLRVVLTWNANDCDVDLWIDDPNGETSSFEHPQTFQGGRLSSDMTEGYGPEEFLLRQPKAGTYRVQIDFFGDTRPTAFVPVSAQVRMISGFGTTAQLERSVVVQLGEEEQTLEVGTIVVGPDS